DRGDLDVVAGAAVVPGCQMLVTVFSGSAARVPADGVDAAAVRLNTEKGAQRPARRVEALGMAPQRSEHVLHDLFRSRGVSGDTTSHAIDQRCISLERLRERFFVARRQSRDENAIGRVHEDEGTARTPRTEGVVCGDELSLGAAPPGPEDVVVDDGDRVHTDLL